MAQERVASVNNDQLKDLLIEVLKEAKKPFVDEQAEAARERRREGLRNAEKARIAGQEAKKRFCPHLREDNTSAIAWMKNSAPPPHDYMIGACQRCGSLFTPQDGELYDRLRRIPTRNSSIIYQ